MANRRREKGKRPSSRSRSKKSVSQKSKSPKNRLTKKVGVKGRKVKSSTISTQTRRRARGAIRTSSGSASVSRKKSAKPTTPATAEYAIVRIMGQGQYRIDKETLAKVNEIDNEIVKLFDGKPSSSSTQNGSKDVVADDSNSRFQTMLEKMTSIIINKGEQLDQKEIVPSDLIVPPMDTPIEEAKELFKGEGIFPG